MTRPPSELVVDAGWVLVAGAIGGATPASSWPHDQPALAVAEAISGTIACLSLLVRRSHPVAVAVFTTSVGAFSPMAVAAAILAVARAAVGCRPRTYGLLCAYAVAVVASQAVLHLERTGGDFGQLTEVVVMVPAIGLGLQSSRTAAAREARRRAAAAR